MLGRLFFVYRYCQQLQINILLKTQIIFVILQNNQRRLKIDNAHIDWIYGLDYNNFNDVLVTGSQDQTIKFFKIQYGLLLIEQQLAHNDSIYKVQLINSDKLISLSSEYILKCWQIDYQNKCLFLLNQITDQNGICNFNYVSSNYTIIIQKNYVKILDKEFKVIKQIDHSQYDDVEFNETNQVQQMNYLIINGHKNFIVVKRELKEQ